MVITSICFFLKREKISMEQSTAQQNTVKHSWTHLTYPEVTHSL